MGIAQYDIYLVGLDPTLGAEIQKTRPCLVISPNEMNNHLRTVQIAPRTTNTTPYPWRVPLTFQRKAGVIALDQIRTVDKHRLLKRTGHASAAVVEKIKSVLYEMLIVP